jgi:hypothetical protein
MSVKILKKPGCLRSGALVCAGWVQRVLPVARGGLMAGVDGVAAARASLAAPAWLPS